MNDMPSYPLSESAKSFFVGTMLKMSDKDKNALLDSFPTNVRDMLIHELSKRQTKRATHDD